MAKWMQNNSDLNSREIDSELKTFLKLRMKWVCEDELYERWREIEPEGKKRNPLNRRDDKYGRREVGFIDDYDNLWHYLGQKSKGKLPEDSHNQLPPGGQLYVPPVLAEGPERAEGAEGPAVVEEEEEDSSDPPLYSSVSKWLQKEDTKE